MVISSYKQIHALFYAAIYGITPRTQAGNDARWIPYDRDNTPGQKCRKFRLKWSTDPQVWDEGGWEDGDFPVKHRIFIYVDYNYEEVKIPEAIISDDHWQLRDVLHNVGAPTNSIVKVESAGWDPIDQPEQTNKTAFQVKHAFDVYLQYAIA